MPALAAAAGVGRVVASHISTSSPDVLEDSLRYLREAYQPVANIPAAFERRCIPPDCVVRRLHMPNMRPPHALSDGRLAALGATRGFTTGCYGGPVTVAEDLLCVTVP